MRKQRIADGWRGGGSGATHPIRLTRMERILVIGAASFNAFTCFVNLGGWLRNGFLVSFVGCQLSAAVTLWLLMKNKGRW